MSSWIIQTGIVFAIFSGIKNQIKITANNAVLLLLLFGVLRRFQHCTGHITTGSWKGRGNQYI